MSLRWFFTSWKTKTLYFLFTSLVFILVGLAIIFFSLPLDPNVADGIGMLLILPAFTLIAFLLQAVCVSLVKEDSSSLAILGKTIGIPLLLVSAILIWQLAPIMENISMMRSCWHLRSSEFPLRYDRCIEGSTDGSFPR